MLVSRGQTTFSPHGTYCWIISASFWSRRLYPTISAMWRKRVWPRETNTVLYIRFILTCNLSPTVPSQQTDHTTLQSNDDFSLYVQKVCTLMPTRQNSIGLLVLFNLSVVPLGQIITVSSVCHQLPLC